MRKERLGTPIRDVEPGTEVTICNVPAWTGFPVTVCEVRPTRQPNNPVVVVGLGKATYYFAGGTRTLPRRA